jgi:type II secretory pathway pseudopilin PulG
MVRETSTTESESMTRQSYRRSWMATTLALHHRPRRRGGSHASEGGFTLIEALLAMVLFVMVASALAGVLMSAVNARGVAREKTVAEQAAIEQVEKVRKYDYELLGFVGGNPSGTIPASEASKTVTVSGVKLLVTTAITYVADPTPTSYATSANYKKIVVTAKRASDSKTLTRQVTYVAPPARAPLGGIGNAIINVQVVDYGTNTPVEGATVSLATGPSAPRSDATDVTGTVTFPALTPNPVSGATAYYDVSASSSGFVTLSDDVAPGTAAHVQVAPGQTLNTAIRIYRPATLTVQVETAGGSAYTGSGLVTVSSSRGAETFAYTGSSMTLTSINGEPIVPTLQYTVSGQFGGLTPTPVTEYVPDDYPSDLTSTMTLTLPDFATLAVTVTQGGAPAAGASVSVTGGPDAIDISGVADVNGYVAFDVTPGDGYIVSATHIGQSVSQTGVVATAGTTTDVPLILMPPVGTIVATVTWAGSPALGKTVTLVGGPDSVNLTGTTDGLGQVTFINLTPGSGYLVTADPAPGFNVSASATTVGGSTTPVTLALPTATLIVNVKRSGVNQSNATVRVTGGPMTVNLSPGTYIGSGNYRFTNVPVGSGYTVKAWASSCGSVSSPKSGLITSVTLPSGGTTVNISYSLSTCPLP